MSERVADPDLGLLVRRGLAWSAASNLVLRLGSLALGIVLARLLTPEQFGVYAVALTVQTVLMTFADLGLSAGLVVSQDPEKEAPTAATLGLAAGGVMSLLMVVVAGPLASALGSPASAPAVQILGLTVLLAGAGVVPYAFLQRRFAQRELFAIAVVDFCVSTTVTLTLVRSGWGVVALAIGRVAAQSCALVLQYVLAGVRPRVGIDRAVLRPVLRFGVPVAATTLLSWAALNIDNVVIARVAGPVELGFYVLAFNIAMWPMSALGQVVRSVALPAFARAREADGDEAVVRAVSLVWALALPAGACLAVLAGPVIQVLYGSGWSPAAPVLAALGAFGSLRVLVDLLAAYLLAQERSDLVLWIQVGWCVALVPVLVAATRLDGARGTGWAHVGVGVVLVVPAYALALRAVGLAPRRLCAAMAWPSVACVPAAAAGRLVAGQFAHPWMALVAGFAAGAVTYAVLVGPWAARVLRTPPAAPEPLVPLPSHAGVA